MTLNKQNNKFCKGLTTPAFPLMVESTAYGEVKKRYELIIKPSIFLQQFPFTYIATALTSKYVATSPITNTWGMLLSNTRSARSYTTSLSIRLHYVELNEHNRQLLNQQRTTRALVSLFYIIMQHEACTSVITYVINKYEYTDKSAPKTTLTIHTVHHLWNVDHLIAPKINSTLHTQRNLTS